MRQATIMPSASCVAKRRYRPIFNPKTPEPDAVLALKSAINGHVGQGVGARPRGTMGAGGIMAKSSLVGEVVALFSSMQQFRRELASIRHPEQMEDRFETVSDQLDAIVLATEEATNSILGAVEEISDMIDNRRDELEAAGLKEWAVGVEDKFQAVFEACSFQDITGQRITKIVGELKYIDERLNSMIEIWGPEGLQEEPVPPKADDVPEGEKLEGPALEGHGVSQDDIDKMFD
jgi:chemotaxis protein CheZ